MNPVGLPLRARIGIRLGLAIYQKAVVGSRTRIAALERPPAVFVRAVHRMRVAVRADRELFGKWRPDLKSMHQLLRVPNQQRDGKTPEKALPALISSTRLLASQQIGPVRRLKLYG